MARSKIADDIIDYYDDLVEEIKIHTNDNVWHRIEMLPSGEGYYEHFGNVGYDGYGEYPSLNSFTVGINLTGTVYVDEGYLPTVMGDFLTDNGDSVNWKAEGHFKEVGDKIFGIYTVYQVF